MSTSTAIEKPLPVEQQVAKGIEAFNAKRIDITALADKYKGLSVSDINDNKQLKVVSEARKELKKERCAIENDAKGIRKSIKEVSDMVTASERELTGIISPVEDALEEEEKRVAAERKAIEDEKERIEQERINNRVKALLSAGCNYDGERYCIGELSLSHAALLVRSDVEFTPFVHMCEAENEKIKAEEAARLKAEAEAAEAERKRIAAEQEQIRKDREELERLRVEAEAIRIANEKEAKRLQDEKEAQGVADKIRKEREAGEIFDKRVSKLTLLGMVRGFQSYTYSLPDLDHNAIIEISQIKDATPEQFENAIKVISELISKMNAEQLAINEKREKAAEAKRLAEIEEAKQQAIRDEAARIEAQNSLLAKQAEADKAEAARQAALAPDKQKLEVLRLAITSIAIPTMATPEGQKILADTEMLISKINTFILTKTKAL